MIALFQWMWSSTNLKVSWCICDDNLYNYCCKIKNLLFFLNFLVLFACLFVFRARYLLQMSQAFHRFQMKMKTKMAILDQEMSLGNLVFTCQVPRDTYSTVLICLANYQTSWQIDWCFSFPFLKIAFVVKCAITGLLH